jgi:hypothetical protein
MEVKMTKKNNDQESRKEWEAKIIAHAWKNQNFKNKLLKDPQSAFREFGFNLPQNYKIQVIEEKENQYTLILPQCPTECQSFSENQLLQFVGGMTGNACPTFMCPATHDC